MNETKNAEGYTDLTAYKAIKKVSNDTGVEIYEGDIWNAETPAGTKQVLILAVHENYASTCTLLETRQTENNLAINSKTVMYADTGKLGFIFKDKLSEFVKAVPAAELAKIREAIASSLNLTVGIPQDNTAYVDKLERERDIYKGMYEDNVRIEADRDIYKRLYEAVIGRMIG